SLRETLPRMSRSPVGAVVLNFNGGDDVVRCAAALLSEPAPPLVAVVENGSIEGAAEQLESRFGSRVVLVRNGTNLGYCEGNNVGIRRALEAGCGAVLLLNDDAFLEAGALGRLLERLESDPE